MAAQHAHGRGGAGNFDAKPPQNADVDALQTPNLKTPHYTTGRGGSGNIVSNDDPLNARKAQDVETPAHHTKEAEGTYHWGRGGEGNVMTVGGDAEKKKEVKDRALSGSKEKVERSGSFREKLLKGKEILGLKGGKEEKGGENAVVED